MSGHRTCLALPLCVTVICISGCQSDRGARKMWNPFAKADAANAATEDRERISLPKFARRKSDSEELREKATPLIAEANVDALLSQGQTALQENRLDDASRAYEEILASVPDNATAHHGLAMAADLNQNWADAEYHYKQALRIRPRDANLLCDIGYSYVLQNRYSEASKYLNQAVEVNPQHENAQMNLALLDLKQGLRSEAERRIVQRYGTTPAATQILAQLESRVTGVVSPIQQASAQTVVTADMSLQEIQLLAVRERELAEKQRVLQLTQPGAQVPAPVNAIPPAGDLSRGSSGNDGNHAGSLMPAWPGAAPVGQAMGQQLPPNWNHPPSGTNGQAASPPQTSAVIAPAVASTVQTHAAQLPVTPVPQLSGQAGLTNSPVMPETWPSAPSGPAAIGRVIPVHSTGAFQNSAQTGGSYGQPIGFNGPPQSMNSSPNNASINAMPASWPQSAMPGAPMNPTSGMPNTAAPGSSPVYLDGLNVGPGSLFPVGQSRDVTPTGQSSAGFPAAQPGSSIPAGVAQQGWPAAVSQPGMSSATAPPGLQMSTTTAPGANSMSGAMYSQPTSTLPSYDWALQQQALQQAANGQAATATNLLPSGQQPSIGNPLESYERERRRLDAQYYNTMQTLQQQPLGPQPTNPTPTARY